MRAALLAAREAGLAFMQHCQDLSLTVGAVMHEGSVSAQLGLVGWPREAEEIIIERDVRLAASTGARYHVQHVSSGGSIDILRRARAQYGDAITAEVSPHHLLLTHEACAGQNGAPFDTSAKMNPPLRERTDVDALIAGVVDGTITVLATDHAPHTAEEKSAPFEDAPFGIIGLESALGLYGKALVSAGHLDWPTLVPLLTINPARLCNLDLAGLGQLTVGGPADVTLIDPAARWCFGPHHCVGKSRNSPFFGSAMHGRAVMTIVAGVVRFEL
jgi:dihydroorotase